MNPFVVVGLSHVSFTNDTIMVKPLGNIRGLVLTISTVHYHVHLEGERERERERGGERERERQRQRQSQTNI